MRADSGRAPGTCVSSEECRWGSGPRAPRHDDCEVSLKTSKVGRRWQSSDPERRPSCVSSRGSRSSADRLASAAGTCWLTVPEAGRPRTRGHLVGVLRGLSPWLVSGRPPSGSSVTRLSLGVCLCPTLFLQGRQPCWIRLVWHPPFG